MGQDHIESVLLGTEPEENCPGRLHPHAGPWQMLVVIECRGIVHANSKVWVQYLIWE